MSSAGFQSQSGQPYLHFDGGVHDICSLRFTCSLTPLLMYNASIAASHLPPNVCFRRGGMPGCETETSCLAVRHANHSAMVIGYVKKEL